MKPSVASAATGGPNSNVAVNANTAAGAGRSASRSRSRVRPQTGAGASGSGPTRTTKSTSKRRDSFTASAVGGYHHAQLPSPPMAGMGIGPPGSSGVNGGGQNGVRPQAIIIPSSHHGHPSALTGGAPGSLGRGAVSPLGMGIGSPIGVGQASGWFLPGATPGSAPSGGMGAGEFSLPTPESVGGAGGAFGQFGTRLVFLFFLFIFLQKKQLEYLL